MSHTTTPSQEQEQTTLATVRAFNEAFNSQDLDAVMALMTDDCIFENTTPAPDGTRHSGKDAVRAAFQAFFRSSPDARFTVEETFAAGDRCVVRWVYHWSENGHVRGVDLFRTRGTRIAEKLSYVKG